MIYPFHKTIVLYDIEFFSHFRVSNKGQDIESKIDCLNP